MEREARRRERKGRASGKRDSGREGRHSRRKSA